MKVIYTQSYKVRHNFRSYVNTVTSYHLLKEEEVQIESINELISFCKEMQKTHIEVKLTTENYIFVID